MDSYNIGPFVSVAFNGTSFLRLNNNPFYGDITFCLSNSFVSGHWVIFMFCLLSINAAMNMSVQMSLLDPAINYFDYISISGMGGVFDYIKRKRRYQLH